MLGWSGLAVLFASANQSAGRPAAETVVSEPNLKEKHSNSEITDILFCQTSETNKR